MHICSQPAAPQGVGCIGTHVHGSRNVPGLVAKCGACGRSHLRDKPDPSGQGGGGETGGDAGASSPAVWVPRCLGGRVASTRRPSNSRRRRVGQGPTAVHPPHHGLRSARTHAPDGRRQHGAGVCSRGAGVENERRGTYLKARWVPPRPQLLTRAAAAGEGGGDPLRRRPPLSLPRGGAAAAPGCAGLGGGRRT